ncbi:hypothetical protein [Thermogemmatispora aurantia]|uniref:hypothetical protein n=1 Tax=Thermogemmatispora aurantia TaxID=2045279 RepID=UPI00124D896D|nr:hypothetical protein [Thermogemmatispora aurantia]
MTTEPGQGWPLSAVVILVPSPRPRAVRRWGTQAQKALAASLAARILYLLAEWRRAWATPVPPVGQM